MTTAALEPPPSAAAIRRRLRAVRVRLTARRLVDSLCFSALAGAGFLLLAGVFNVVWRGAPPLSWPLTAGAGALAMVAALIAAASRRPTLVQAAAWIDARAQTRDRFQTALDFSARSDRTPLQDLALAECARFVDGFSVRRWIPIGLPRAARWIAAPLLALVLLSWYDAAIAHRPKPRTALDAAVNQRAAELEKIAAKLRQTDNPSKPPDLDKIAEEMKKSAERLKGGAAPDEAKRKEALRELSSLEAMLNALKAAKDSQVSPGELAALAAALAASEETRKAAEALKAGQLGQAASELEKLLQQLNERGDAGQTLQQLARSMQEQAAKLTEQEKNEVARQMQQAAQGAQSGQMQLSQQALQRLAELLRQAGRSGAGHPPAGGQSGKGGGQQISERQLQDLLNALANMKEGLRPGDGSGGKPGDGKMPGEGQSLAIVESFSNKPGDASGGELPSGQPGGEHDTGHSDKVLADKAADLAKPQGQATRLEGMLGQGESLQQFVGAASDSSKASKGYRELYDAMAPAAQEAVEQENIPLGSRFFIRRYFENIRPPE